MADRKPKRGARAGTRRAAVAALLAALVMIALLFPREGRAQASEPEGYRQLIAEAVAEFDAGNFVEAYTLFSEANKAYPNARTQRGIGMVAFELRRYSESERALEQALASNTKRLEGSMRSETEQLLARARRYIARLELRVEPRDAEVLIDGTPVLRGSGALVVDAGNHNLKVRAAGDTNCNGVVEKETNADGLMFTTTDFQFNVFPRASRNDCPGLAVIQNGVPVFQATWPCSASGMMLAQVDVNCNIIAGGMTYQAGQVCR